MTSAPRLAVIGASGRMGLAVVRLARGRGLTLTRAIGRGTQGEDVGMLAGLGPVGVTLENDVDALASGGFDVAIDFSAADLTTHVARVVGNVGASLVSGTTGLTDEGQTALSAASARIPVLSEPNLSVGVHVLGQVLRQALASLGAGYDIEIVETHHARKVDAPSGTALRLAAIAAEATGEASPDRFEHGREGRPGPRTAREIGLHAVRGGDVIGDHSIHLLGQGERLELVHRATDRDLFAHGALRAAAWLIGKPAGRYTLSDVFG